MQTPVWVVGSANLDFVFNTARFPKTGETILGGVFTSCPGGKGANQAVAIGKLGGAVSFVGCVGADAFGDVLEGSLKANGVDTRHLKRVEDAATGCASIVVDGVGSNQIIVASGANLFLSPADVNTALQSASPSIVLCQLEVPLETVEAASRYGRFILNPAPAQSLPNELLERCFAITPNETEMEILTGIEPVDVASCRAAAEQLLEKGVKNVVITLGGRGSFWKSGADERLIPAKKVQAVDTVAAGDAFNGALAWCLANERDWPAALETASAVAALSVSKPGAQDSMPTLAELQQFTGVSI